MQDFFRPDGERVSEPLIVSVALGNAGSEGGSIPSVHLCNLSGISFVLKLL
jgi:hypothetical protein